MKTSVTTWSIYERLCEHSANTPSATALLSRGRHPLTYRRLQRHVETVAETLNRYGVGRNDRVALVLPNGPETAAAFLSVSSCATTAPLNPGYREQEFEFYLADLHVTAVIVPANVDSVAIEAARRLKIPLMRLVPQLDQPAGLFELEGKASAPPAVTGFAQPEDTALVLHTSGTTSRPKIVPLTHSNLYTSAVSIATALQLNPADRCLNIMPLFHIHGLMAACLSSISAGASVISTPGFDRSAFFQWIEEFHPTWYTAVPTMHQAIVAEAERHPGLATHAKFRFVRSSSAPLPSGLMRQLERTFSAPVIESYGMTEASHQMTSNPLPPASRKPGSVGVAAGPRVAVMDETGTLLSPGRLGEVVIQGKNVTLGYENDPAADRGAFTNGFFRTGDQGYLDEDGYLFITGRLKELINRGGEKVAPREIDEALLEHPAVTQAAAFGVPHPTLGEDVAAAVVLATGADPPGEKCLRDFVFDRLSAFKVPSQIAVVDQIPKGATGKVQRIGLARQLGSALKAQFVPPRDELEAELAKIWCGALGVDEVGVHDNYFGLGGDSLIAATLFDQIETRLGVKMPLATLFRAPTIGQLAPIIEAGSRSAEWSSLVPIQPEGSRPALYFVHAHGGNVVGYRDLVRHLGPDQPFYGLQAKGLDGLSVETRRIEQIAADYVKEILRHQPTGPYYIGGWCFGSVVAFEMGRQLARKGMEVPLVIMVEARHPGYPTPRTGLAWARPVFRLVDRLDFEAQRLREVKPGSRLQHLRERSRRTLAILQQKLRFLGTSLARLGIVKASASASASGSDEALENVHREALVHYRPKPYSGPVMILRARQQPRGIEPDRHLGWARLLQGNVTVSDVPGYPVGLLSEPRVRFVATLLRKGLASHVELGRLGRPRSAAL